MFQPLELHMERVEAGWEVRSKGHRGIIFATFYEAMEAVAEYAGTTPADLTVRHDGTVVVHRDGPDSKTG
ncbi:MAG: hypothetical protein IT301_05775 [Dehalococcoidia bacterium]|nr:hypothetical protein [Dehalococcoidia bacterium]